MKNLFASLGLGLFALTTFAPITYAKETVAGTMQECLVAQADAREQFGEALTELQKGSKSSIRDKRLIDAFRKRLTRQKKITPAMQALLDSDEAWGTSISDKLVAYFTAKADLLESYCSTDPAKVLNLLIAHNAAEIGVTQVMVDYYSWIETNYSEYKKLFPTFYHRKVRKWFQVDKPEMATELARLKTALEELKKEPAVFE